MAAGRKKRMEPAVSDPLPVTPGWAQPIEQTVAFVRHRPLKALMYGLSFALVVSLSVWAKDVPLALRQALTKFRQPLPVPRSSISWDFSPKGTYSLPLNTADPITIEAPPGSWPHEDTAPDMSAFPRLTYSMSGDFDVLARVRVSGEPTVSGGVRLAGVGIMSRQANQMLLLGRSIGPFGEDVRSSLQQVDPRLPKEGYSGYVGDTKACNAAVIELKIVKTAGSFSVLCRAEGKEWTTVRQGGEFKKDLGNDSAQVFVFAYAADSRKIKAIFSDFAVLQR